MLKTFLSIVFFCLLTTNTFAVCIFQTASGRITDINGNGIQTPVKIESLLDIDPVEMRVVNSKPFGYYSVPNVISCENYLFTPMSKTWNFNPVDLIVIPSEQSTNLNFTGEQ